MNKGVKVLKTFGILFWALFCGLAVSCLRLVSWTFRNWGNLKADELFYTLTANLSGTNLAMVKSGILYCVPPGIMAGVVMFLIYMYSSKRKPIAKKMLILLGLFVSIVEIIGGGDIFFQ